MKSTIGPGIAREWYRIIFGAGTVACLISLPAVSTEAPDWSRDLGVARSRSGTPRDPETARPRNQETEAVAEEFEKDVKVLASDRMEGRGLGTQGLERSDDW